MNPKPESAQCCSSSFTREAKSFIIITKLTAINHVPIRSPLPWLNRIVTLECSRTNYLPTDHRARRI